MPKLVKVGYSERDPVNRASELGAGTEVPFRYEVIYDALVYAPFEVEQSAHQRLAELRAGKEWFECDWMVAVSAVRSVAIELGEILAEKEYELLVEYRQERQRQEQELRDREARERELRERLARESELRAKESQEREALARKEADRVKPASVAINPTRIVVCPKCHSTVKTSGKPPPYFCVACGTNFLVGV